MEATRESDGPYYDLIDDFGLITASFQAQYGIRLSRDLRGMKWDEFRDLLVGISPESPLGRIVSIRAENDKDMLKHFTKDQKRIRSEWRSRMAKERTAKETGDFLESIKQMFISMAGGANAAGKTAVPEVREDSPSDRAGEDRDEVPPLRTHSED